MYFRFFKLKKRGEKTAEARRHNCAVLPFFYYAFGFCITKKPHPVGWGVSNVGITYLSGQSPAKYCRRL